MKNFDTGCTTNLTRWVLLAVAAMALAGCGGEGTKENAPATAGASASTSASAPASTPEPEPTPDSTSAPAPLPTPGVGNATISWAAPTQNTDGSALTNLAGYKIYYGTNSASLSQSVQVGLGIQTYVVENLSAATWYFSVKAYTTAGVESDNSNLASKTIS